MKSERLYNVILSAHISEKASNATEKSNVYVFRVSQSASKPEVKDAIEFLFNTKVKSVTMLKVKPKKKIFRGREGARKGWKKAYVTLQSDQKLEMIPGAQ